jgi:hypothetical protein
MTHAERVILLAEIRTKVWKCATYKDVIDILLEYTDLDKDIGVIEKGLITVQIPQIFSLLKLKRPNGKIKQ